MGSTKVTILARRLKNLDGNWKTLIGPNGTKWRTIGKSKKKKKGLTKTLLLSQGGLND